MPQVFPCFSHFSNPSELIPFERFGAGLQMPFEPIAPVFSTLQSQSSVSFLVSSNSQHSFDRLTGSHSIALHHRERCALLAHIALFSLEQMDWFLSFVSCCWLLTGNGSNDFRAVSLVLWSASSGLLLFLKRALLLFSGCLLLSSNAPPFCSGLLFLSNCFLRTAFWSLQLLQSP